MLECSLGPVGPPGTTRAAFRSDIGAVSGGWCVRLAAGLLDIVQWRISSDLTAEHLLVGLAEILGQESVDDGVDGGVAVGQAVGRHS